MFRLCVIALSSLFLLSACASGTFKARQEQREKMATAAGLYCEFINGDQHPDTDVELNMQMAKRCDASKNFSIINYKNASDQIGVMYCCGMQGREPRMVRRERSQSETKIAPVTPAASAPAPSTTPSSSPSKSDDSDAVTE